MNIMSFMGFVYRTTLINMIDKYIETDEAFLSSLAGGIFVPEQMCFLYLIFKVIEQETEQFAYQFETLFRVNYLKQMSSVAFNCFFLIRCIVASTSSSNDLSLISGKSVFI